MTFVYVILSEAVGDTERRRGIPPVDFVKDRIEIWEISTVVVCWEALGGRGRTGEHLVEFGLCLCLHVRDLISFLGFTESTTNLERNLHACR